MSAQDVGLLQWANIVLKWGNYLVPKARMGHPQLREKTPHHIMNLLPGSPACTCQRTRSASGSRVYRGRGFSLQRRRMVV